MLAVVALVINPVNVAAVIVVDPVRMKSSAASISILPVLDGRVAIAIWLVTDPVLKKMGSARAGAAHRRTTKPNNKALAFMFTPYANLTVFLCCADFRIPKTAFRWQLSFQTALGY